MEKYISMRSFVGIAVIGVFVAMMFLPHISPLIIGAVISRWGTVVDYFFGGSKVGSETAAMNADTVSQMARSSDLQPVIVTNRSDEPVPTVEGTNE